MTHPLLDVPAIEAPTAVLDFETTGLSPASGDRAVEIAVTRGRPAGGARKRWSRLVYPGIQMPEHAQKIHGISDEMVRGQPRFGEILPELAEKLRGAVVVAHNAPFDIGFLRSECHLAGMPVPEIGPVVCTLDVARFVYGFSKCSLEALARRTGTPQDSAHRALADTATTLKVYRAMLAGLPDASERPITVRQLLQLIVDRGREGAVRRGIEARVQLAGQSGATLTFDYTMRDGDGPLVERQTVHVKTVNLPYFEGWCPNVRDIRSFNVRRVHRWLPNDRPS